MSFSADIEGFAKRAGKSVDDTLRAVALELFSSVIKDTPVDTGRARGSWQTTLNTPARGDIDRLGDSEALAEMRSAVASFGGDQTAYLTSNLVYIIPLEEGSSDQAPAGMARKNAARIQQIVRKAARDNKI